MQTALSRNWTLVGESTSYDDNHYATDASIISPTDTKIQIQLVKKKIIF